MDGRELGGQKIDRQIYAVETRKNTLPPISRLPIEILSRIFITIAYSCFRDRRGPDLSWIRSITWVCSHWRAIALDYPGLWSFISLRWRRWAQEMLKRSKMSPLFVRSDEPYYTTTNKDTVHLALQHISRITELHLVAFAVDIRQFIDRIDKRAAPLLRSLHLSNGDGYALPETLFVDDGHHLQRLELVNCIISWDSPLLCGLVHLKLEKRNEWLRPTMAKLLDALEKMPLLETLDLAGWLPTVDDSPISRIVRLPHLTSLSLSPFASECAYLLSHISYPATTSLSLSCILSTPNDVFLLSDAISPAWNGSDGSKLLRSLNIYGAVNSTTLRGWITNDERSAGYTSKPAQIKVKLQWTEEDDEEAANAIFEVCKALTLTDLRSLFVFGVYPTSKATWLSAFGQLTSLRTLHVRGQPAPGLVSALSTVLEEGDSKGKVLLPNLRELSFKEPYEGQAYINMEFLEDLRDCLMTRCHWNAVVQFLYIVCPEVYCFQVELLREVVVDVVWHCIVV